MCVRVKDGYGMSSVIVALLKLGCCTKTEFSASHLLAVKF